MHPGASDAAVLRAARVMAVGATVVGFVLTAVEPSVIAALGVFYGAIGATLSAPILAALFSRANRMAAMASMVLGVAALIAAQRFGLNWLQTVTGAEWVSPPLTGLFTNLATYLIAALAFGRRGTTPQR
jgi:Na+(H+)/acetate symporter ActP